VKSSPARQLARSAIAASFAVEKLHGPLAVVSGRPRMLNLLQHPRLLGMGAETQQEQEERHLLNSLSHLVFVKRPMQYLRNSASRAPRRFLIAAYQRQ
jgi:hypothetical protein